MKLSKRTAPYVVLGVAVSTFVWAIGVKAGARDTSPSTHAAVSSQGQVVATAGPRATIPVCGRESFAFPPGQVPQPAPGQPPPMVEDVFKNVQVLKGIHVDDFMNTMGLMSAALSFCCSECHTGAGTDRVVWEADTPRKRTARRMTEMVMRINKESFGGRQVVTCWTCHRGRDVPVVTPDIGTVYGAPVLEADDIIRANFPGEPSADSIIDKYLQAIGGTQRLAKVTSLVATGTSEGFGGFGGGGQVQIFANAPDQRTTIIRFPDDPGRGNVTRSFDGRVGWIATPLTVLSEYALGGSELDGARFDAQMSFPGQIKQALTRLRVGPPDMVDGREVHVVQGNGPRDLVVTMYFDDETGLLLRVVRFGASPIGRAPTQVDYTDYRDVSPIGIKIPYRWTFSWLDGRDTFVLKDVRLNVPTDPAVFGKPAPPKGP